MSKLKPEYVGDYSDQFIFWAHCGDEVNCKHGQQLTGLKPDDKLSDVRANLVCSKCGCKENRLIKIYAGGGVDFATYNGGAKV